MMAANGNEMGVFQLIKPEPFSGERGSANVDDFLDTLELTFPYLERQVVDPGRRERAKVLALQSHLEGKAKAFLIALRPASKTTYVLAAAALHQRFPVRPEAGGDE